MLRLLLVLVAALAVDVWPVPVDGEQRAFYRVIPSVASYSTTFQAGTENPLAESSVGLGNTGWVNGNVVGLDWADFQTTTGKAFGTQTAAQHGNSNGTPYNDSIACKRPPLGTRWSDAQDVRGRVFITSRSGWSGFHEVELWARCSITANKATAYEAIFSVLGGTTYYEIVRWNGPIGAGGCTSGCAFTSINNVMCAGVEDQTYIRFIASGTTLTQQTSSDGSSWATACSGTATITDTTYGSGMPGMGHWTNGNGAVNTYGLSQWSAQEYVP